MKSRQASAASTSTSAVAAASRARVHRLARPQQRLGRDAGAVGALAADQLALDDRDLQPAVGQRPGAVLAGRAAADDDHVVVVAHAASVPLTRARRARTSPGQAGALSRASASCSPMRELIPSLVNTLRRCHSTVRGLRNSWAPISEFVRPSRASRAICSSCGVSSSRVVDRGACAPSRRWPAARAGRARRTPPCPSPRTRRARRAAARGRRSAGPRGAATRRTGGARGRARRGCACGRAARSPRGRAPRPASPSLSSARDRASMPERPVGAGRARHARSSRSSASRGELGLAAARGRLDELGQRPADRRVQPPWRLEHALGRGEASLVVGRARCGAARPPTASVTHADALAARHDLLERRVDQRPQLALPAPPGREDQRAVRRQLGAGRLGHDLRPRRSATAAAASSPAKISATMSGAEGEREHGQRARLAHEPQLPRRELAPALVVPQSRSPRCRRRARPAEAAVAASSRRNALHRSLQQLARRRACPSASIVARPSSSRSGARGERRGRGARAPPPRSRARRRPPSRPANCGGHQRLQVGLARERHVERLELPGGAQQQRGSVAAAVRRERDLPRAAAAPAARWSASSGPACALASSASAASGAPACVLGLRRRQRPPRALRRVGRERGRPLQERRRGREPAARLRAPGRVLELRGHLLVRRPPPPARDATRAGRGSASGSVTSASASCTSRRSSSGAER